VGELRKLASLVENSTDFIRIAPTEGEVLFKIKRGEVMLRMGAGSAADLVRMAQTLGVS
jgi:FixJ family two-component response regulator